MYWIYCIVFFSFDLIVLQPIKFILTCVLCGLWKPPIKDDHIEDYYLDHGDDPYPSINEIMVELNSMKYDKLFNDGDGFKYLSLLYGALLEHRGYEAEKSNLLFILSTYISDHGIIGRYPVGMAERYKTINFSGDMASGLVFMIGQMYKFNPNFFEISTLLRDKLILLFDNTTFELKDRMGFWKRPFAFTNANREDPDGVHPRDDRGFLYPIYGLGPDIVRLLSWLMAGYIVTGKFKYRFMYLILRVLYAPIFIINPGDYGIFYKKYMAVAWYTAHSHFYFLAGLHAMLPNASRWKKTAKKIFDNRQWNADIVAGWYKYFDSDNVFEVEDAAIRMWPLVVSAKQKGKAVYIGDVIECFDIKSWSTKTLTAQWCIPAELGNKYLWENNPIEPVGGSDDRRKSFIADRLFVSLNLTVDEIDI